MLSTQSVPRDRKTEPQSRREAMGVRYLFHLQLLHFRRGADG